MMCGALNMACCAGNICQSGGVCVTGGGDAGSTCMACGGSGQRCCTGEFGGGAGTCSTGFSCVDPGGNAAAMCTAALPAGSTHEKPVLVPRASAAGAAALARAAARGCDHVAAAVAQTPPLWQMLPARAVFVRQQRWPEPPHAVRVEPASPPPVAQTPPLWQMLPAQQAMFSAPHIVRLRGRWAGSRRRAPNRRRAFLAPHC